MVLINERLLLFTFATFCWPNASSDKLNCTHGFKLPTWICFFMCAHIWNQPKKIDFFVRNFWDSKTNIFQHRGSPRGEVTRWLLHLRSHFVLVHVWNIRIWISASRISLMININPNVCCCLNWFALIAFTKFCLKFSKCRWMTFSLLLLLPDQSPHNFEQICTKLAVFSSFSLSIF